MSTSETPTRLEKPAVDAAVSRPHRPASWLIAVAAIALVAVGGVAGWLLAVEDDDVVTDDGQAIALTADQQEAIEVVTAHRDATNDFDRDAMWSTLTPTATWNSVTAGTTGDPLSAKDYVDVVVDYRDGVWTWTGEPIVTGDLSNPPARIEVAVPTHRELSGGPDADGILVYKLRDLDGQLKIQEIYWIPLDQ